MSDRTSTNVNLEFDLDLHHACSERNCTEVKSLLERNGGKIEARSVIDGSSPFHLLAEWRAEISEWQDQTEVEIAKLLIKFNYDPNIQDSSGKTWFHIWANGNHNIDLLKSLLPYSNIQIRDKLGRTALHYYDLDRFNKEIEHAIDQCPNIINATDIFGLNALQVSLLEEHVNHNIIRTLIQQGTDINNRSDTGLTSLHIAVLLESDVLKVVKLLLENGADPNAVDKSNLTPLHYAALMQSDRSIIKKLVEHGGDFSMVDSMVRLKDRAKISPIVEPSQKIMLVFDNANMLPNEEAELNLAMQSFAQTIINRIGATDPRFYCTVHLSGSMNEGTNAGSSDEYDFMCFLSNFGKLSYKLRCGEKGRATVQLLKTLDTTMDGYAEFFGSNGELITERVMRVFRRLIDQALHEQNVWHNTGFVIASTSSVSIATGPSVCLRVLWHGCGGVPRKVSIDFVPSLAIEDYRLESRRLYSVWHLIDTFGLTVVMPDSHNVYKGSTETALRVSMSHVELAIMQAIPVHIKKGYVKAKSVRKAVMDKTYSFIRRESSTEASKVVKTYALKTALFHVLHERHVLSVWREIKVSSDLDIVRDTDFHYWCTAIYQFIVDSNNPYIPSFFFPKKDVYTSRKKCIEILDILTRVKPEENFVN